MEGFFVINVSPIAKYLSLFIQLIPRILVNMAIPYHLVNCSACVNRVLIDWTHNPHSLLNSFLFRVWRLYLRFYPSPLFCPSAESANSSTAFSLPGISMFPTGNTLISASRRSQTFCVPISLLLLGMKNRLSKWVCVF